MAMQSEPITIYDVPNYTGQIFFQGAQLGKSPVCSAATARNGFRIISGQQYSMSNALTGDAAQAHAVTEDASIAAATYTSHAAAQDTNYPQLWFRQYAVSYARQVLNANVSGVAATGEPLAQVGSLQVQRRAHLMQLMADIEFSCLYGTAAAWTNAATQGATGGLLKAVEDGSETAAAGATLSKTLIATETARMAAAGAEFIYVAVVVNAHQIQVLNDLYGFAEQSRNVGGVNLDTVLIPLLGRCTVMYNPVARTDDLGFVDLAHFQVCIGAKPGMDAGVVVEPVGKIAAGEYEQIWAMFGVDFTDRIHNHARVHAVL